MRILAGIVLLLGCWVSHAVAAPDCPDFGSMSGLLDYRKRTTARSTGEYYHFNSDVETLRKGQSALLGSDIVFVLRMTPNHARALNALSRLSLREKSPRPEGTEMRTECWLYRAIVFQPDDGTAKMIYGNYLARLGRTQEAFDLLKDAEQLMPGDGNLTYNLGLVYFDLRDYEQARAYAKRAAELGFPLPGLRQKLVKAGQWRE